MLQLLAPLNYARIKPLASKHLQDHSMALAVLAGTRPGIVFANDKIDPSAAFIAAPEGSFVWAYLAGDDNDSVFQQDLNRWWFDDCGLGQDVAFSFLVCDDTTWEPALASILQPRVIIPDRRLLYTCTQRPGSWRTAIPAGYSIRSIDQGLLDSSVEIPGKVSQWFDHNFGSCSQFLTHGFGTVAIHSNQVVAWSLADSVVGDRADIGVETDEAHRRKGLGYCSVSLTLEQAFARGIRQIGWHCHLINVPSVKTAEAAGFQLQREYPAYAVHVDVERHAELANIIGAEFITQATEALEKGNCQEAHSLFNRTFGFSVHDESGVYLLAARAAVSSNDLDAAFTRLMSAVERGWSTAANNSTNPEFVQLQSDPRWLDLAG